MIIGIPNGTLTMEESYELGKLLLKCGYSVKMTTRKLSNGKKLKTVEYMTKTEEEDATE